MSKIDYAALAKWLSEEAGYCRTVRNPRGVSMSDVRADEIAAALERAAKLEAALIEIAAYEEGSPVTASFDEPASTAKARRALESEP